MTVVVTAELMADAVKRRRGLPAFNVLHLETVEAIVSAAESAGFPVVLQLSENAVKYHGALEPIARASIAAARASSARIAVHLDHAESEKLAREAIELRFGSVMYDGSVLDYARNVDSTARVAAAAHAAGLTVEAELGRIGGKDGAHSPDVRTDPAEATRFVAATGVDALAVAVGSSHAMRERTAALDLELISRLRDTLPVPLVLHGSSGVPDATIVAGIRAGMTKINVSTQLNRSFTAAVREYLQADPSLVDSRKYLGAGREALRAEAARLGTLIWTAGGHE